MAELIRQGEIMLVPTSGALFGQRRTVNTFVVGHSESGHNHVLDSDEMFDLITFGDDLLIELFDTARLAHDADADSDRHHTLVVPPGTYRVARKRSYNPVSDRHGFVAD